MGIGAMTSPGHAVQLTSSEASSERERGRSVTGPGLRSTLDLDTLLASVMIRDQMASSTLPSGRQARPGE